jgi:hypothetical protein
MIGCPINSKIFLSSFTKNLNRQDEKIKKIIACFIRTAAFGRYYRLQSGLWLPSVVNRNTAPTNVHLFIQIQNIRNHEFTKKNCELCYNSQLFGST